jgi:hypothetical protein
MMFPLLAAPALAGSLADINHVILFMQGIFGGKPTTELFLKGTPRE